MAVSTKVVFGSDAELVANIEAMYKLATKEELFGGMAWYPIALSEADVVAREYRLPLLTVVGCIAATSPQTPWNRNIKIVRAMIVQYQNGLPLSGHTGDVIKKVRAILDGASYLTRAEIARIVMGKKGFKTLNFFYDILGIDGSVDNVHETVLGVTVDRWHASVAYGSWISTLLMPELKPALYTRIALATHIVAERHKLEARQLQAIVWVVIRRLNGIVD